MGLKAAVSLYFERNGQWNTQWNSGQTRVPQAEKSRNTTFIEGMADGAESTPPSFDCTGAPDEWIDGVLQLHTMRRPQGVTAVRWRHVQFDATRFLDRWATQAMALGWTANDVFGVNRDSPFERLDAAGLVRLLDSREIAVLTTSEAVIAGKNGAIQTYRRQTPTAAQVLLWELGQPTTQMALPQLARLT